LVTSLKQWKKLLGLQAWGIQLVRVPEKTPPQVYPGMAPVPPEELFSAGYCKVDPYQQRAIIYVAPDRKLAENGMEGEAERVLVHELLHLKLGQLILVPNSEEIGQTLLLENVINSLTRAFFGMRVALPAGKRGTKNETRPEDHHVAARDSRNPRARRGKGHRRRNDLGHMAGG
jgi:hypothetical protein